MFFMKVIFFTFLNDDRLKSFTIIMTIKYTDILLEFSEITDNDRKAHPVFLL